MDARNWSCEQVSAWLKERGFSQYVQLFGETHKIDGAALLTLTERDLREPPLALSTLGDIKRLGVALQNLQEQYGLAGNEGDRRNSVLANGRTVGRTQSHGSEISFSEEDDVVSYQPSQQKRRRLKPEYLKLFIAFSYMSLVLLLTAYVMVVVHDRVPDMNRYPPLPDLMLDNIPYIPWAFQLCELTALFLSFVLVVTLVFHKHRFIIVRRLFVLTGTLFLLRCVTMWITSLSVPGTHLKCFPKENATFVSQFERALVIWKGAGMSIQGVRSCGDYMFSGHTVVITLLNFFITEYTPRGLFFLHMSSWMCNMFGLFFILAAHEHYSIDVFIGFYISSRLFLYYHSLANNCALRQQDGKRTRTWFPLFSFFESETDRIVPNQYQWPLKYTAMVHKLFQSRKVKLT